MEVGITLRVRFLPEKPEPLQKLYTEYIDDAVYGEQLGFDLARTSEHHFAPDAWMPAQFPVLAAIGARTSRVRLSTNVLLMPFHNPLRVAEDTATIDLITNGRMDLAVGTGSIEDEFQTYGIKSDERWGRMFESLDVIRRCFEEDQFDHKGKYFNFPNVRMTTKPVQKPFPIWVGGGPQSLQRAAKAGYHLASNPSNAVDLYKAAGRDPDDYNLSSQINLHLSDSEEKAWDEAEAGMRQHRLFYAGRDWIGGPNKGEPLKIPALGEYRTNHDRADYAGTPEEVLRALEPSLKNSRLTHFSAAFRHAGMQTDVVRKSMDMFAKEMLPELKRWGRTPRSCRAE